MKKFNFLLAFVIMFFSVTMLVLAEFSYNISQPYRVFSPSSDYSQRDDMDFDNIRIAANPYTGDINLLITDPSYLKTLAFDNNGEEIVDYTMSVSKNWVLLESILGKNIVYGKDKKPYRIENIASNDSTFTLLYRSYETNGSIIYSVPQMAEFNTTLAPGKDNGIYYVIESGGKIVLGSSTDDKRVEIVGSDAKLTTNDIGNIFVSFNLNSRLYMHHYNSSLERIYEPTYIAPKYYAYDIKSDGNGGVYTYWIETLTASGYPNSIINIAHLHDAFVYDTTTLWNSDSAKYDTLVDSTWTYNHLSLIASDTLRNRAINFNTILWAIDEQDSSFAFAYAAEIGSDAIPPNPQNCIYLHKINCNDKPSESIDIQYKKTKFAIHPIGFSITDNHRFMLTFHEEQTSGDKIYAMLLGKNLNRMWDSNKVIASMKKIQYAHATDYLEVSKQVVVGWRDSFGNVYLQNISYNGNLGSGAANEGVVETQNNSNISVYPNPTQNNFSVKYTSEHNDSAILEITDIAGNTLLRKNIEIQFGENIFNIENRFSAGTYFVTIRGTKTALTKIVVK